MRTNTSYENEEPADAADGLLAILETYDQIESMQRVLDAVASLVVSNRLTVSLMQRATALCEQAHACHQSFRTLTGEAENAAAADQLHTASVSAFETQATELFSRAQSIRDDLMAVYKSVPNSAPFILPYFANLPTSYN